MTSHIEPAPAEIFLNLVVTFLTSMFLIATAALSSVAQHLLSNAPLPPSPLTASFQLPFRRP